MDTATADPFRPVRFEDITGQTDWKRFQDLVSRSDPPHIILVGPAGVGKSCATRLALGPSISMWLRCSQDPTLRDSRDRIKAAARRRVEAGSINWIVLEHADLLHTDAQAFLRRIIETSLGATRFILEVRDIAAIAEPLLSRTLLFQAPQLLEHEIRAELLRREPTLTMEMATRIATQAEGNNRWAILQALGGGDGMIAPELGEPTACKTWGDVLRTMETLQRTGTNPRAWLRDSAQVWERPGGACPWAVTALRLADQV